MSEGFCSQWLSGWQAGVVDERSNSLEAKTLVDGGWEPFHKKYPKAPGITLVSRPGLNAEHTRALLYIGTSCDMLCSEGVFILLGKDGGQWKVLHKETIWVS